jgi:hypothetical protein
MFKKIKECKLTVAEKWCKSCLVTYPVSYEYNGGMDIDGKWYKGYQVAKPKVPKGFKLYSIGCGLQLNAHPPYATAYLEPLDDKKYTRKEIKTILASL